MSISIGLDAAPAAEDAPAVVFFDALITPNRSLSDRTHLALIVSLLAIAIAAGLFFVLIGLWFASLFVVMDGVFLAIALKVSRRDLGRSERVRIAGASLHITRTDPAGRAAVSEWPLWGLAIETVDDPDYGLQSITLCHRARRADCARDLSPAERSNFLAALVAACRQAGFPPRRISLQKLPLLAA
jgi:uncharacterized membrane protein